jgi:plasmid stability protein
MADLLVRGVEVELVRALKERAVAHGRTAEAEHREILAAMPDVGADADFELVEPARKAPDVFD